MKSIEIFRLIESFSGVLTRKKEKGTHRVRFDGISIRQRIEEIVDLLAREKQLEFEALLEDVETKIELIVSFLAILEMAKMRLMKVYQTQEGDLFLRPQFSDRQVVLDRLSGLDESQYV